MIGIGPEAEVRRNRFNVANRREAAVADRYANVGSRGQADNDLRDRGEYGR
jgi:hypothetical protein